MKVTFEINSDMLIVAAGIVAISDPSRLAELMEYAESVGKEDVSITKEQLEYFAMQDKNYSQIPLLVAMCALAAKASEEDKEDGKD